MSAVLCSDCGRGRDVCQWCESEPERDWRAICDCGLHDFGAHLLDCRARVRFRYVVAIDHDAASILLPSAAL